jgi:DNA-binding MarR family transcriptional regulator
MDKVTAQNAAKQDFMPLMRGLVRAYQAFTAFDVAGHRDNGLTPSQADVIFTLGNTEGMTFKEIGEHTLITKGTLTGVVDRLEQKGLVKRVSDHDDRRCTPVRLTARGVKLFEKAFPQQIAYLKTRFDRLSDDDRRQAISLLKKIEDLF